ncbi:MAG: sugar phosphate isomerase/epimerase [Clostridiales Family XIII bacterium]|jgi:D-psicose/D-tagatose/L-ribulose 3-epimerase|nr:sugar phosphate isomerase/epimerase [Clostridiales Family XIII bacterium]
MKVGMNSLAWSSPFTEPLKWFKLAKAYGCDVFEIAVEDFSVLDADAINAAKDATGIETPTVVGAHGDTRDISSDDPAIREEGIKYLKDATDFCNKIGATVVAGPAYSAVGKARQQTPEEIKQKWDFGVENLKICADYAGEHGVKLAIEALNRFETDFINTVAQAVELIDRVGYDNVGLLLDSFHMNIEENDIVGAIKYGGTKSKILDFHSCANDRGTPGKDNFDWPAIAAALKEVGYDDYFFIESFTPDCVEIAKAASVWRPFSESPEAIARDGIPFLKSLFN